MAIGTFRLLLALIAAASCMFDAGVSASPVTPDSSASSTTPNAAQVSAAAGENPTCVRLPLF